jgi:hypothetical protein
MDSGLMVVVYQRRSNGTQIYFPTAIINDMSPPEGGNQGVKTLIPRREPDLRLSEHRIARWPCKHLLGKTGKDRVGRSDGPESSVTSGHIAINEMSFVQKVRNKDTNTGAGV